jgi:hypothetical protein
MESIVVLIVTYALLNFSRVIINLFENIITPWVYKLTKPSSIVTIDNYNFVIRQRDELSRQFDNERADKLRIQADIESTKQKHSDELSRSIQDNRNLRGEMDGIKSENEQLKLNLNATNLKINELTSENRKLINDANKHLDNIKLIKELQENNRKLNEKLIITRENDMLTVKDKSYKDSEKNIGFILESLISKYHAEMERFTKNKGAINSSHMDKRFIDFCIKYEILDKITENNGIVKYSLTSFGEKIRERYLRYYMIAPGS